MSTARLMTTRQSAALTLEIRAGSLPASPTNCPRQTACRNPLLGLLWGPWSEASLPLGNGCMPCRKGGFAGIAQFARKTSLKHHHHPGARTTQLPVGNHRQPVCALLRISPAHDKMQAQETGTGMLDCHGKSKVSSHPPPRLHPRQRAYKDMCRLPLL